jgi:1,4-alpha-glucan branching enzyme
MVEISAGDKGSTVITFRLPRSVEAETVCVVGEFNDWSETANPMTDDGDGFVAQIELIPGRRYRFRYLLDGERWENDWAADAYVANEYGGDDSVIDLTDPKPQNLEAVRPAPKKKPKRARTMSGAKDPG